MNMQALHQPHQPLDIIVGGKGNQVIVELDIHHNDRVNIGDRYVVRSDDHLTILRVTEIEYPDDYNNFTARRTRAMREGIVGLPDSRPARERPRETPAAAGSGQEPPTVGAGAPSRRSSRAGNAPRQAATRVGSISRLRTSSPTPASASTSPCGSTTIDSPAIGTPPWVPASLHART